MTEFLINRYYCCCEARIRLTWMVAMNVANVLKIIQPDLTLLQGMALMMIVVRQTQNASNVLSLSANIDSKQI